MGWNALCFLPCWGPQITILKITIAPHTTMKWHSHPLPNAGYILSGELTIEREDGTKEHFVAGQAVTETVNSVHRGITGAERTVLIVFYPGAPMQAMLDQLQQRDKGSFGNCLSSNCCVGPL
jgi:quercetin dioxygenase-like cupin family protein